VQAVAEGRIGGGHNDQDQHWRGSGGQLQSCPSSWGPCIGLAGLAVSGGPGWETGTDPMRCIHMTAHSCNIGAATLAHQGCPPT